MPELVYYVALVLWSGIVAYYLLFGIFRDTSSKKPAHTNHEHTTAAPPAGDPPRSYSMHEGFKSYKQGEELTVEDIVKGLSRNHR